MLHACARLTLEKPQGLSEWQALKAGPRQRRLAAGMLAVAPFPLRSVQTT